MRQRPTLKPTPKKPEPLTAAIIADMAPGEERGDSQCPGLRVRSSATGKKVFFYRYRSQDGALREIILDDVGPLTLAKARATRPCKSASSGNRAKTLSSRSARRVRKRCASGPWSASASTRSAIS